MVRPGKESPARFPGRLRGAEPVLLRPATLDILPIIGELPGQEGVWCAFGHSYQGLTLGPTTRRLLAEMMTGAAPFLDPEPYRPDRF